MILKLIRFFRGYVVFRILGRFPERFINLSIRQGYYLFDARSDSSGYYASMLVSDYLSIRPIARKTGVKLRIFEKHGVPVIMRKHRKRKGLIVGLLFFLIFAQITRSFVWTVELHGVETASESEVISVLYDNGLYPGALTHKLNLPEIEASMMSDIEEIGWMSINIIGTKAEVEIKEKEKKPDIVKDNEPCNVTATEDGVIKSVNARQGTAVVLPGSVVVKGQLLVSSIMEDKQSNTYFVRADADVLAHTHKEKGFVTDTRGIYTMPLDTAVRKNIRFLWVDIPFRFDASYNTSTKNIISHRVCINDTFIELGVDTERCTQYRNSEYVLSEKQGYRRLMDDEALHRFFELYDCTEIKQSIKYSQHSDKYILDVEYDCVENITRTEKLIVN